MFSPSFVLAVGVCNVWLCMGDREIVRTNDDTFVKVFFGLIVLFVPKGIVRLVIFASINLN